MKHLVLIIALATLTNIALSQNHSAGAVQGVVRDVLTKNPIEGASVEITGDTLRTTTDSKGQYTINNVGVGYRAIFVRADEHHSFISPSFMVSASAPATVDVQMERMDVALKEVVVSSSIFVPTVESPVSLRRIGQEEIDLTPGATRDISKVVQSSPGVVTIKDGNRNDILVRGGGANENKYYLDGIEIPVLNHFAVQGGSGGHASLVNTELLRSVNFYTGAFPANLSNGVSSIMDMQMNRGNSQRPHAKFIVGASDVGVNLDTPLSKSGNTTLLASYRRSYLQFLFSALGLPFLPTYNDYQFKITSKIDDRHEIFLIGLGSIDKSVLNRDDKNLEESRKYILGYLPENRQMSYVFGAGYRYSFNGGEMRIVASRNYLKNELTKNQDNDPKHPLTLSTKSREEDHRLRAEVELYRLFGFRFTAGVGGGNGAYRSSGFRTIFSDNATRLINIDNSVDVWRYELFATLQRRFFNDRLSILAGARIDAINYSRLTSNPLKQLSPRLSILYKVAPRWNLSASIGRYHQEPTYTAMGYGPEQKNALRYMAVSHFVAGVEFSPRVESIFKIEGFYKKYDRMPISLIDSLPVTTNDLTSFTVGDVPIRSLGRGRSYGAEFSYRNLNIYNTVVNVTYTLLYAQTNKMDNNLRPTSEYVNSSWDIRHIVNISAIHKFKRNWTLGAKWQLTGGYPYTPYDMQLSSLVDAWNVRLRPYADNKQYNEGRTPCYHQLDMRLDKVWFLSKWRVGFYIDIQNIYNYKAKAQDIIVPMSNESGDYVLDGSNPKRYIMKRLSNDIGGTILPTLGITIEF